MKKEDKNKVLNYRGITLIQIKKIVNIKKKDNDAKFDNWFAYDYKISGEEQKILERLIKKNKLFLASYNEYKLFARFIVLILDKVDFNFDGVQDWYGSWLRGELNGVKFSGRPDFMVAKGDKVPEKPYFFISEFKRTQDASDPEDQVLAEMLVAMEINKVKIMYGCYIIGQHWFFVILEKLENNNYEYFVSESFDCLKINNLKRIYKNLKAAKTLFCKD